MKPSIDVAIGTVTAVCGLTLALLACFAAINGAQLVPMGLLVFAGVVGMVTGIAVCVVSVDGGAQ